MYQYLILLQLRSEKVQLENTLEAEGESQVLRLSRQLSALRLAQQQQQQQQQPVTVSSGEPNSQSSTNEVQSRPAAAVPSTSSSIAAPDPRYPNIDTILEALRRENDSLRKRLYVQVAQGQVLVLNLPSAELQN
jgi:hypothetical protein